MNVYLATYVTDDPFRLVLIWTVLSTTTLVFEIPAGIIADVYSRRLSVIIGFAMLGIGTIIEGVFQILELVLLSQVIWDVGYAFTSGARCVDHR